MRAAYSPLSGMAGWLAVATREANTGARPLQGRTPITWWMRGHVRRHAVRWPGKRKRCRLHLRRGARAVAAVVVAMVVVVVWLCIRQPVGGAKGEGGESWERGARCGSGILVATGMLCGDTRARLLRTEDGRKAC